MFVHLGGDTVIDVRQVVAILDARRLQRTPDAQMFFERTRPGQPGTPAGRGEARAIVVTTRGVFLARISPETVAKRIRDLGRFSLRETAER